MKYWITISFLLLGLRLLASPLPRWNESARKTWWTANATAAQWTAKRESIQKALLQMQEEKGPEWAMHDRSFLEWMNHVYWLSVIPEGGVRDAEPFRRLSMEPELPWLLLAGLQPEDDAPKALTILLDLYIAYPAACRYYPELAVAMALVWDQPPHDTWPHPFVDQEQVPWGTETPVERFEFYLHAHQEKKLLINPGDLSVHELVFMVDSAVTLKELRVVQGIKVDRPRDLVKIYQSVTYDRQRLQDRENVWSGKPYTFKNIGKEGGICMDQAYAAWQTGKSKGVPTMLFSGLGANGVHAWIVFLESKGAWTFDVGRIKNDRYPVGRAIHPQTRTPISDFEQEELQSRKHWDPAFRKGRMVLGWARMNPDHRHYPALVLMARRYMPTMLDTWLLEDRWHVEKGKNAKQRVAFLERWVEQFKHRPPARFEGQKRLYRLYVEHGLEEAADRLKKQIVKENRSDRFDLGIHLAVEAIFNDIERNQWDEARKGFERAMNDFDERSRGHLFYHVFRPYVQACITYRQPRLAKAALRDGERFEAKKGTVMWNDLEQLKEMAE